MSLNSIKFGIQLDYTIDHKSVLSLLPKKNHFSNNLSITWYCLKFVTKTTVNI